MRGRYPSSNALLDSQCARLEIRDLPRPFELPDPEFARIRRQFEPSWDRQLAKFTATWSDGRETRHVIEMVTTRPHFGGVRYWFLCPHCERRFGKLYAPASGILMCRVCLSMAYLSQYVKCPRRGWRWVETASPMELVRWLIRMNEHPPREMMRYLKIEQIRSGRMTRAVKCRQSAHFP